MSKTSKIVNAIQLTMSVHIQNSRSGFEYTFSFWTLTETLLCSCNVQLNIKHKANANPDAKHSPNHIQNIQFTQRNIASKVHMVQIPKLTISQDDIPRQIQYNT